MKAKLRIAFENEMLLAQQHYAGSNFTACFHRLERAHILGQRHYLPHLRSHYWMFKAGLGSRDLREVLGQIPRMIASFGSLLGIVPVGNTGRARVPALRPMPVPADLQIHLSE